MKRASLLLLFLFTFVWMLPSMGHSAQRKEYLVINQPRVLKRSYKIGNITIGNPAVVDFKADRKRNRVALIPKSVGSTLLIIYDHKGKERDTIELTVYPSDPEKLLSQVRQLLIDVEGIEIKRMDDKIIIDGELIIPSDKERIQKVKGNAKNIIDLTRLNPDTNTIIAKKIEKEIGMDEVSVRALKGRIILEGEVYSQQSFAKAEKIAKLYSDRVLNVLEIRQLPEPPNRKPTIQVTAHFVEMAKNYAKHINFRWNPIPGIGTSLNYTINPLSGSNNFTGALTASATDILPKLNYYRALGVARVLENPSVSVTSGDEAIIKSGTRIGFPTVQQNGVVSLDFQDVGAELTIRPFARGSEIDLDIDVQVSSLGSPEVTGGVAISSSSVHTSQFVRSGESVVIGGLVRYSNRKAIDKPNSQTQSDSSVPTSTFEAVEDPFPLGSLFTLFSGNDEAKNKSQFLIFITPKILQFAKDANREIKDQFNLYEVYPENVKSSGSPGQGGSAE